MWQGPTLRAPRAAFRPSWVFLGIVALVVASGALSWFAVKPIRLYVFVFVIAGWVLSLCLHEYAHALTAYRSGDLSVAQRGYLRLNPLKYTHWLLSLVMPLVFLVVGGFGLPGGAVWIDHAAIRNRARDTVISLAGPGMNLLFTGVLVAPLAAGINWTTHWEFWSAWAFLGFLQLTATVLNLLPIPGMDGGNALRPWLSYDWRRGFDAVAPYGLFVFILLLWSPQANHGFFAIVDALGRLIHLNMGLAGFGRSLFMFWR